MSATGQLLKFDGQMDFTVSIIREARDTVTNHIGFRNALSGIKTGRWAKEVAAVQAAYQEGYKNDTPYKPAHGEALTGEAARVHWAKEAASPHKKKLPGILFSGTFHRRAAEAIDQPSGLICADLDHLGDRVGSIKEHLIADDHVLAVFVSPTGTGLKVIFRCDPNKKHKEETFPALEKYVAEHFGLLIDEKCDDISRICFVSNDSELLANDRADVIPYPPPEPKKAPKEFILPPRAPGLDLKPGEDFNARGAHEVPEILKSSGWTHLRGIYWCRPGKTGEVSATWGYYENTFIVHSNSPETGFPSDQKGFDPFAIFTHLKHGGQYSPATKELAARGYGKQNPKKTDSAPRETPPYNENVPVGQGADQEPGVSKVTWPEPVSASALCSNPPVTPPVVIDGILYRGGTMLISGPSKSHKTYTMLDMAIAIAEGKPWLGFNTIKTPVLYLNLELQDFAATSRLSAICAARGQQPPPGLHMWNLRGHQVTLDKLALVLPQKIKEFKAGAVMIDPHYKISSVSGMEENSNDDQGKLLSALEGLCVQNGAAVTACHHFAKGDASAKNAIDRASGGGVFARWGDVMLTFTPHEEDDAMTVEMALRNFAKVEPFVVKWVHPRWARDEELDPTKLKQQKNAGAKERFSADEMLKKLSDEGMTYSEWHKASGYSETTFKRKRDQLLDENKIVCQMSVYTKV